MELKLLTTEQHIELTSRLILLARNKFPEDKGLKTHSAGIEYTSLMICFFLQIISSIETILMLYKSLPGWFPVTNVYIILRSVFEVNITAHYISKKPYERAIAFIEYGKILNKKTFDKFLRHKDTKREPWRSFVKQALTHEYYPKQTKINQAYQQVKANFEFKTKKGKKKEFINWANKSLREMAKDVEHEIEYDIFYAHLSNFTHGNVKMANRFLQPKDGNLFWSMRSNEVDIAFIFRYAATFLSCFLALLGTQFGIDIDKEIEDCWTFG